MQIGEAAFEFVELSATEQAVEPLLAFFRRVIADVGFIACAGGAGIKSGENNLHRFYFNDWPPAWLSVYEKLTGSENDLVVIEAARRMKPFLVSDIRRDPYLARASAKLLGAFDDFGWKEVLGVPVHGPGGYNGLVALAAMQPVALQPAQIAAIEMMCLTLHRRCRETPDYGVALPATAKLTSRQVECLRWAAAGKTDAEIGYIIGVTAATAHYHIEMAKKRLNVGSRVEAIAQIILSGQM